MEEIYEFLKQCGVYFLATMDGDQPRVRPFGTIDLYQGKLYIQTGRIKAVASQMKANPKVELAAIHEGQWIRITAEAVLDDNVAAQEHMLAAYPSLQAMYRPGDGNTEVYYLKNGTAQFVEGLTPVKTLTF